LIWVSLLDPGVIEEMRARPPLFTAMSPVRHVHGAPVSVRGGWLSSVPPVWKRSQLT
jgi:hypothetical protein